MLASAEIKRQPPGGHDDDRMWALDGGTDPSYAVSRTGPGSSVGQSNGFLILAGSLATSCAVSQRLALQRFTTFDPCAVLQRLARFDTKKTAQTRHKLSSGRVSPRPAGGWHCRNPPVARVVSPRPGANMPSRPCGGCSGGSRQAPRCDGCRRRMLGPGRTACLSIESAGGSRARVRACVRARVSLPLARVAGRASRRHRAAAQDAPQGPCAPRNNALIDSTTSRAAYHAQTSTRRAPAAGSGSKTTGQS